MSNRHSNLPILLTAILYVSAPAFSNIQPVDSPPIDLTVAGLRIFEIRSDKGISRFRVLVDGAIKEERATSIKNAKHVFIAVDYFDSYSIRLDFGSIGYTPIKSNFLGPDNQCSFVETSIPPTQRIVLNGWVSIFRATVVDRCAGKTRVMEIQFQ